MGLFTGMSILSLVECAYWMAKTVAKWARSGRSKVRAPKEKLCGSISM